MFRGEVASWKGNTQARGKGRGERKKKEEGREKERKKKKDQKTKDGDERTKTERAEREGVEKGRRTETMETLANIATDLRIVQEPFEELIRSDQTTVLGRVRR